MARAQQGQVIRGGGIDPYVAQASMQRSAARNRMKETMVKEAGATKRQGMQGAAQVAQANIQAAAQKQMQDARSADAERARREEMEFRTLQDTRTNEAQVERDKLLDSLETAREERRLDLMRELSGKLDDEARYENLTALTGKANAASLARNIGAANQKAEVAKEKITTWKDQELKKHEEMRGIAATATETAIPALSSPNFTAITDFKEIPTKELREMRVPVGIGAWGLVGKGAHQIRRYNDQRISGELNKVLNLNGVGKVTVEMLLQKDKLREVEDIISSGDMISEDFVPLHATLSAAQKMFSERAITAGRGKGDEAVAAIDFYNQWVSKMVTAQHRLRQLNYAKTSVMQDDAILVGSVARQGNLWASEDFDPDWFEARHAAIEREKSSSLQELGNPDSMAPGVVGIDSPFITPADRGRPNLMQRINNNYLKASKTLPQYFPPSQSEEITIPTPIGRTKGVGDF